MNEITLLNIKKRIGEFYKIMNPILTLWNIPHFTMITVMVQNMAFSGQGAVNYNYQKEIEELYKIKDSLKLLAEYYDSSFENWVYGEIDMIIFGETYSEDIENECDLNSFESNQSLEQ